MINRTFTVTLEESYSDKTLLFTIKLARLDLKTPEINSPEFGTLFSDEE